MSLPRRSRGRQTEESAEVYAAALKEFCNTIQQIQSTLDLTVSSRGWCYILENRGLMTKSDFDTCQVLINDCRKSGDLPLDICMADDGRSFDCVQEIDGTDPAKFAASVVNYINRAHGAISTSSSWGFS